MRDQIPNVRVILIGGSSHVGKSTVANSLAVMLGWTQISTDGLARHPGRPWRPEPEKVSDLVAKHYLSLSTAELLEDVLLHYQFNVWPKIEDIVATHLRNAPEAGVVLEGSAIWPDFVKGMKLDNVGAFWLTTGEEVFRKRILSESQYRCKSPKERAMVDKFLERTLAYDALMTEIVNRNGYVLVDVQQSSVAEIVERCLSRLKADRREV